MPARDEVEVFRGSFPVPLHEFEVLSGLNRFSMSGFVFGEGRIDLKSIKWGGVRIFKSKGDIFYVI